MAIEPNPITEFDRATPNDGDLFGAEFAQLYANDADLEAQIAAIEVSVLKQSIELSKQLGEFFFLPDQKDPGAWAALEPDKYFPAICLTKIDVKSDITAAVYGDFITFLRAIQIKYRKGKSDEESSWTATISGSTVTMPNTTASNRLLVALAKWALARGNYTDFITLTVAGTDYNITNINTVTREITVSGTPASGSQSVTFYPHRIAGSSTSARVHEVSGKTVMAGGDAAGLFISGLQCLGYFQGHLMSAGIGSAYIYGGGSDANYTAGGGTAQTFPTTGDPVTDGVNGTPRTASETHSPALIAELHQWARTYTP